MLDWTAQLCSAKGCRYEVWSGADPVRLRNLRFLAAGRRLEHVDQDALGRVAAAGVPGMTLAQIEGSVGGDQATARAALLSLLWFGHWTTDLSRPLSHQSVIETAGVAA